MPRVPCDWIGLARAGGDTLTRVNRGVLRMLAATLPDAPGVVLGSAPLTPAASEAFGPDELEGRLRRLEDRAAARLPLSGGGPPAPPEPLFACVGCGAGKPAHNRGFGREVGDCLPAGWRRVPAPRSAVLKADTEYHCPACWEGLARPGKNLARAGREG